jgi:hypothetical protein
LKARCGQYPTNSPEKMTAREIYDLALRVGGNDFQAPSSCLSAWTCLGA